MNFVESIQNLKILDFYSKLNILKLPQKPICIFNQKRIISFITE